MSETTFHHEVKRSSIEPVPSGLRMGKLDELVGLDKDIRVDYARDKENVKASYDEYADAIISMRLRQNGIEDNAKDESQHSEYVYAKGLYANVSKLSEVEWLTTPEDGDVKRRTLVLRELLDRYDQDTFAQEESENKEGTEEQQQEEAEERSEQAEARKGDEGEEPEASETETEVPVITPEQLEAMDLEALARAKHEAFAAKVNGPAFGQGKEHLQQEYDLAEAAYLEALRKEIELKIIAQGYDETQMRDYITARVNERIQLDAAAQREEVIRAGGIKGRILARYANLSTGKKILATAGIGLVGAAAGVGLGALGAGAAFTVATIAGIRYGRSYAMRLSKIYKDDEAAPIYDGTDSTDIQRDAIDFLSWTSQSKIEKAERIKKRAVFGAMGAVALGGALGTVAHIGIDHATDFIENNSHWWGGYLQHIGDHANGTSTGANPNAAPASPVNPGPPNYPEYGHPVPEEGHPVDGTGAHADNKPEFKILGSDERTISNGEGWYQTFHEMGVSSKDQAELLKDVGPHLHEKGLAYWDSSAHEWRMNMTENGKLPVSAIRYIADTAHENGIHTSYDKFFDTPATVDHDAATSAVTHEFSSGAQHIGNGEGFYHELGQMGVATENQAEVLQQAAPQLYDQGAAYQMNDGLPGINMTPDHMMPQESLETLHQAAIETNVSDSLTTTHDGIVFDEALDSASTTTTDNGEFLVTDFGKSYDVDAQSYYDALRGLDRSDWQTLLNEAAPKLQSVKYDGESLTYHTSSGWHFREVEKLPSSVTKILADVADKHGWTLAA